MTKFEVTFHNKIEIRTLVQIFSDEMLISSSMSNPGESCVLSAETGYYDIFVKHGMTGWELARKLGGKARNVTLSQRKGRYVVT